MRILNIHKRAFLESKDEVSKIFASLSGDNDQVWPTEKWPRMIFENGLKEGEIGRHGIVKYSVNKFIPSRLIEFTFIEPKEFKGIHKLELNEVEENKIELKHTIDADLSIRGIFLWYFAIKWLHDALLEDCLDKVENHFLAEKKKTKWNFWVKFLRRILK